MAFTGTPAIQQISDTIVRIANISLATSAAGTISLSTGAGEVLCPAAFKPTPYGQYGGVDLAEAIEVTVVPTGATNAANVQVVKTASPFLVTITNNSGSVATATFEVYLKFHT